MLDAIQSTAYISARMQLLLILSAMLSALTGAFGGVRAPVAVEAASITAVAPSRVAMAPRAVAAIVRAQPAPAAPLTVAATALVLRPIVPLFASRRRE